MRPVLARDQHRQIFSLSARAAVALIWFTQSWNAPPYEIRPLRRHGSLPPSRFHARGSPCSFPPYSSSTVMPSRPRSAHLSPKVARELVDPVDFGGARRYLVGGELPDRRAQLSNVLAMAGSRARESYASSCPAASVWWRPSGLRSLYYVYVNVNSTGGRHHPGTGCRKCAPRGSPVFRRRRQSRSRIAISPTRLYVLALHMRSIARRRQHLQELDQLLALVAGRRIDIEKFPGSRKRKARGACRAESLDPRPLPLAEMRD